MKIKIELPIILEKILLYLDNHPNELNVLVKYICRYIIGVGSVIAALGWGDNAESLVLIITALKQ